MDSDWMGVVIRRSVELSDTVVVPGHSKWSPAERRGREKEREGEIIECYYDFQILLMRVAGFRV